MSWYNLHQLIPQMLAAFVSDLDQQSCHKDFRPAHFAQCKTIIPTPEMKELQRQLLAVDQNSWPLLHSVPIPALVQDLSHLSHLSQHRLHVFPFRMVRAHVNLKISHMKKSLTCRDASIPQKYHQVCLPWTSSSAMREVIPSGIWFSKSKSNILNVSYSPKHCLYQIR